MMQPQLDDSLELLKTVFGPELLGVYLFGSALVGGLQKFSDLDVFVVTNRATSLDTKKELISNLLKISGLYMKSPKFPIEMTIVEKSAINPWQYPPHFDFQYGEWLRESFEAGVIEPWDSFWMPDLAIIVTQVLLKSRTLFGADPQELLAPVPYRDFMTAMLEDVNRLSIDLAQDTRNVLLTLARIWSTIETNAIRSKPAAADWVLDHLPREFTSVMQRAKSICVGLETEFWDDIDALIKPCADYMIEQINTKSTSLDFNASNIITLAQH